MKILRLNKHRGLRAMQFDRQAKVAFVVACLTLVLSGLGFRASVSYLNVYLLKKPVDVREHFATIPRVLGDWRAVGQDLQLDEASIEELGTATYLDRTYRREGSDDTDVIMLHIAYYTGMIDTVPHVPDRCMVAGGFNPVSQTRNLPLHIDRENWSDDPSAVNRKSRTPYQVLTYPHRITARPVTVRMPIGDFEVRTTEFTHSANPGATVFAGFFFIANGHVTANPLDVRMLAFDKTDEFAYYCKVQFTMIGDASFDDAAFADRVSSLMDELLPEIMRCLPDWAEVESTSGD